MPEPTKIHERRHGEWAKWKQVHRWLQDSYEAGETYRDAVYGYDHAGMPIRNLIRHKREYPDPVSTAQGNAIHTHAVGGTEVYFTDRMADPFGPGRDATPGDYELRLARTPVPEFVREAVDDHLGRIYSREVRRDGPEALKTFWKDVDGQGKTIDDWMAEDAAWLFLVNGQIDLYVDRPHAEVTGEISEAEAESLGLNRAVARIILPQNMLWWRLEPGTHRYRECLVREVHETDDGFETRLRHWTTTRWTLYTEDGEELESQEHSYGQVPIRRVFDRRRPRESHTGQSRYEGIAERQREFYNRDSELILSDSLQAHPMLQGPQDLIQGGSIAIGPGWTLMKARSEDSMGRPVCEGWESVDFGKNGAESIRLNKADIRAEVDRIAHLTRPAGMPGVSKGTVEQSGISKHLDMQPGQVLLKAIAASLARVERTLAELVGVVLGFPVEPGSVSITYPDNFDLYTASDVSVATSDFLAILSKVTGIAPDIETRLLARLYRLTYPGQPDQHYLDSEAELQKAVAEKKRLADEQRTLEQQAQKARLDPGGAVRHDVRDTTQRLQPPGQTGKPNPRTETD